MAKEMKRDMEKMLTSDDVRNAGAAGTARASGGYASWIGTTAAGTSAVIDGGPGTIVGLVNNGTGSPAPGPDGTTVAAAGTTPTVTITLAMINLCVSRVWALGGTPDIIMCDGTLKQSISTLGGSVIADLQKNADGAKPATAVNAIDVLVTDFGTFQVVPSRFCLANRAYIMDMDLWSVDYLRSFATESLAKAGDSVKQMIIAEYGLRGKNGEGSGQIKNCK